jgi:hypothetical protein
MLIAPVPAAAQKNKDTRFEEIKSEAQPRINPYQNKF